MSIILASQILTCSGAYLLATFLPGYLLAKWLRCTVPILTAFVVSLLLLCQGYIWLEILRIPLTFVTMLGWEIFWTVVFGVLLAQTRMAEPREMPVVRRGALLWILFIPVILTGALLLLRTWLVPLTGPDLCNRWDQLAREVLRMRNYRFYPPVSAADFEHYGFAESLPPMLTSVLWWIYAAWGGAAPRATAPIVVLQYIVLLGFVGRLAHRLSSALGGALAMFFLAATPLTFFALILEQETGLIAIGTIAMLYFVLSGNDDLPSEQEWRSAVLAGIAAAFAPLSREYAWSIALAGLAAAFWSRRGRQWIVIFGVTTLVLALPWYLRTWALTGNPFYSLSIFGWFPTNPIVAGQYRIGSETRSIWAISAATWKDLFTMILYVAPLALALAVPVLIYSIRKYSILVIAFAVCFTIWLMSVGLSDGGWFWTRTLLPALSVLAVLIGAAAWRVARRWSGTLPVIVLVLTASWTMTSIFGMVYPRVLRGLSPDKWLICALSTDSRRWDQDSFEANFTGHLRPGCRVLSTDIYAWSSHLRTANEVVPLWSPEVRFIFDPSIPLSAVYSRLARLNIEAVWYEPDDLRRFPPSRLYTDGRGNWKVLFRGERFFLYALPK